MDEFYKKTEEDYSTESETVTFRDILVNAIKMQAIYSNGKIKYTETSLSSN